MPNLSFKFQEQDCIRMILEFLENRDLNISQLSIERETGVFNGTFSEDILFLRQLILDGQWDHVFQFISPLESIETFNKNKVHYTINKYKYIELLCIRFEVGPFQNAENCVKKIVECLNELEKYCPSKEDYNNFCLLLTLQNFEQHPDYKNWNPSSSRIKCFNEVLIYLEKFLPIFKKSESEKKVQKTSQHDRLMQLIIKGVLYESCVDYCQKKALSNQIENVDLNSVDLLEGTGFTSADLSLLSWLQSIPSNIFNFQFEDKKLNVNIEKLNKPFLIATWSEMMLSSPIKPQVFPHSATPFTKMKTSDVMSKSLTSGIVDGLSKSIMSFSLKNTNDLSHSSIATTEFHLNQTNNKLDLNNKNNDEKLMEKMFEEGNVFNSSLFGKLPTIEETPIKLNSTFNFENHKNQNNNIKEKFGENSFESFKQQLENIASKQWEQFLKKKDEILGLTEQTYKENSECNLEKKYLTPNNLVGQSNYKDLSKLFSTSTPKAWKKDENTVNYEFNPVKLNFSKISLSESSIRTNEIKNKNHSSNLTNNTLSAKLISPSTLLNSKKNNTHPSENCSNTSTFKNSTSIDNLEKYLYNIGHVFEEIQHSGSNNSSLKSPNVSLDSGVVAKTSSSLHLNGNTLNKANSSNSQQNSNHRNHNNTNNNHIKQKGLFVEVTKLEDVQAIRAIEFHPRGSFYAIGSNSKTLRICNYTNTQHHQDIKLDNNNEVGKLNDHHISQPEIALTRLKHHKGSIFCLGWNLTGELLATGSNDQTIKLIRFDEETCSLLEDTEQVLQMHDATVRDLCFMQDISNNSNLLISGGAGNCKIYITDCQTVTPFQAFSGHSGHILSLYTWGGAVFVSGSQDRTIRFWDLRSRGCVNLITAPSVTGQGAGGSVSSVTVDPSGRLLVSGHDDASCMLYDIRGQRVIQTFKPHNGDIRCIRFSPKAYYLLSGGYDNNVVLTDLQGDLTQPLSSLVVANHQDKVIQTKWHPNDFSFLTSSADKSAILWTLPS